MGLEGIAMAELHSDDYVLTPSSRMDPSGHSNDAPLYLVSCVKLKRKQACEAHDLYISDWFRKARRHVEQTSCRWLILSAQYGLVEPTRVLSPYELTLNRMKKPDREKWGEAVWNDLQGVAEKHSKVIILAGRRYAELLVPRLIQQGVHVELPLQGLGIGLQLRWFKEHTP